MPEVKNGTGHTDAYWIKVDAVAQLILENPSWLTATRNPELVDQVMRLLKVQKRQAQEYVTKAKAEVKKLTKEKKKDAYNRAIWDRHYLINRLKKTQPMKAFEVMKDRDKLQDLYSNKVEVSGTINFTPTMLDKLPPEALDKLANAKSEGDIKQTLFENGVNSA